MNKINKGYTLTVTSWENDADHYNTKSKTVATLEEAKVWYEMMQLCKSKNNQPAGVVKLGNTYGGFNNEQKEVVKDFMKRHHKILVPGDDIEANEDNLTDWFCDLAGELLGYGEDYACRVMESCVVTYSPVDVIPEIINL
jgi:hypothetical protein